MEGIRKEYMKEEIRAITDYAEIILLKTKVWYLYLQTEGMHIQKTLKTDVYFNQSH